MHVWYVSYGSNICENRFLCYINGDKPQGSDKKEIGCRDKTLPRESGKADLPYSLYFAKEKSKWGPGGVAFIGHDPSEQEMTIGRKFLITDEQFSEVVAQENNEPGLTVDFQKIMKNGYQRITDGWYGRVVYLGNENGYPMFTFTNNQPMNEHNFIKPSSAYLSTIARGLIELGLNKQEVADYFMDKNGIIGIFSKESLMNYIFS